MKNKTRILTGALIVLILTLSIVVVAQIARPYRNGSVWDISYIRMKPGMETAYLNYLATDWKKLRDEQKKSGQILSYKVLTTEAHSPTDFNIMLMVEFKDMATMEAGEDKADALTQRVVGDDQKQMQGYKERLEIREIIQDRLAREIVLEPRR